MFPAHCTIGIKFIFASVHGYHLLAQSPAGHKLFVFRKSAYLAPGKVLIENQIKDEPYYRYKCKYHYPRQRCRRSFSFIKNDCKYQQDIYHIKAIDDSYIPTIKFIIVSISLASNLMLQ